MRTSYKIVPDYKLLVGVISALRWNRNQSIVFTNGGFDIFHAGHVQCLEYAKSKGDILVVGINSDMSIKRLKGNNRPIIPQEQRLRTIAALQCVDYVIVFDEDTPYNLIMLITPDVLVKGGDWEIQNIVGSDIVKAYDGEVFLMDHETQTSSSKIIETIIDRYKEQ